MVGCSDSSVDPLKGAAVYSWVLANAEETGTIIQTEPTKTSPDDMTSFWGKLTGVHSMVNHVVKNWKRDKDEKVDVNLELWCNNEDVLKPIDPTVRSTFVALCKPEGGLVNQTRSLLQQLGRSPSTT